jgi:hypothetical protein
VTSKWILAFARMTSTSFRTRAAQVIRNAFVVLDLRESEIRSRIHCECSQSDGFWIVPLRLVQNDDGFDVCPNEFLHSLFRQNDVSGVAR